MRPGQTPPMLSQRRLRRWGSPVALATAVALLGACGGHHRAAAVPTTADSTTLPAPTTTSSTLPPPTAPLTGLPQPNKVQLHAVAVVVKIDNVDAARPQTGINEADVVYEELVEGGLTRLAAVFQSQYPAVVGPVRSGRLTDEGIADDLNHPVFAYSGTNAVFLPLLQEQPLTGLNDDNAPSEFYRSDLAAAPHNLYADVADLGAASTTHSPPRPLFDFLSSGAFHGAGIGPVSQIGVGFPNASITWDWSPTLRVWLRSQNGTADVVRSGVQLSATNVIVQVTPYYTALMATGEGGPPAPIPAGVMTGSGTAWFFSNGHVVKGTWSRTSLTAVATYKDSSGATIQLTRGRTWVELVPTGTIPDLVP